MTANVARPNSAALLVARGADGSLYEVACDNDGNLQIGVGLTVQDLQIGAVEIKGGTTSNRAAVDSSGNLAVILAATEVHLGEVGGRTAMASANFTRPADTTAYASGDLVANSTTAGSVTPMTLTIGRLSSGSGASGMIRRARLRKTGTSVTNASFRLHLYRSSPTVSNGDNGAWLTNNVADYVGALDITVDRAFTDGASGNGTPITGSEINFSHQTYYGLLEARAAYTPANAEVFTLELEVIQN